MVASRFRKKEKEYIIYRGVLNILLEVSSSRSMLVATTFSLSASNYPAQNHFDAVHTASVPLGMLGNNTYKKKPKTLAISG